MGFDCFVSWENKTEKDAQTVKDKILEHMRNNEGMMYAPNSGYLRERYGQRYQFVPFLFREAFTSEKPECRITSQEFRRRYYEIISDLRACDHELLSKKYTYANDPIKKEVKIRRARGEIIKTASDEEREYEEKHGLGPGGYYFEAGYIKFLEEYYEEFAKYLESVEKDENKVNPFIIVDT